MKKSILKKVSIAIVIVAVLCGAAFAGVSAYNAKIQATNNAPQVFASSRMLLELWGRYKQDVLEPESLRTLDKSQGNITTSEGQSYTMMRAAWMDDIDTFDRSWQWTKDNLQREDKLMSWKYGQNEDGNYGIQTSIGGQNTATDADIDIAFSLLMAAGRWSDPKYKWDAVDVIKSIWEQEVVIINGKPVLVASDIEKNNLTSVIVNPSYFSPHAFRVFAKADPSHDWLALVDSSYDILEQAGDLPLDAPSSAGLTPNWIRVDRTTGAVIPSPEYDSNYGYDAIRTPWRLALDWNWNKDKRAKEILSRYTTLGASFDAGQPLASLYSHDGAIVDANPSPAMSGSAMAYFEVVHPEKANDFYTKQLLPYYNPDIQNWKNPLGYYDTNWVWFGLALHNNQLINLTELIDE
ncbi:MAG: hypothetical protein EOO17_05335 [Chloroflexi bacterium]|nr:MAG: hypothetical protein EOO17_05335 [Chloroflexota bacterium]